MELLALEAALERLKAEDPRKHRLVELRFFAGLTARETAELLGMSLSTLEREWRYARARLHAELCETLSPPARDSGVSR